MLSWLLLSSTFAIAQSTTRTFSGTITEKDRGPRAGISLTVEARDNTILAFGFSDGVGNFSIILDSPLDSVWLRARSMSHAEWMRLVRNASY